MTEQALEDTPETIYGAFAGRRHPSGASRRGRLRSQIKSRVEQLARFPAMGSGGQIPRPVGLLDIAPGFTQEPGAIATSSHFGVRPNRARAGPDPERAVQLDASKGPIRWPRFSPVRWGTRVGTRVRDQRGLA